MESEESAASSSAMLQRLVLLNLVVVAFQPLVLMGVIFGLGLMGELPLWGRGLALSWAFYLPLWSLFGGVSEERPSRLRQEGFLLTSLVFPLVVSAVLGRSLWWSLYEFASYHTLGIGLAFGGALLVGPWLELEVKALRVTHLRVRSVGEMMKVMEPLPVLLVISVILFCCVTLGPLGAEVVLYERSNRAWWFWVMRYIALIPEVIVLFGLLIPKTIYARRAV